MDMESVYIAVLVSIACYVLVIFLIPRRYLGDPTFTDTQVRKLVKDSDAAFVPSDSDPETILRETVVHSGPITRIFLSIPGSHMIWPKLMKAGFSPHPDSFFIGMATCLLIMMLLFAGKGLSGVITALAITYLIGMFVINRRIGKRNQAFIELFPEALDMIVRSVRSGYPLGASVRIVSENMTAPLSTEFKQVADEMAYGSSLIDALHRLSQRIEEPDIRFFVVVLAVQQEVGGNLAEVLTNLAGIIRKRKHLRMKLKALTSEGRATAWVLGSLPVLEFAAIYYISPKHLEPLFNTATGNMILGMAVGIVLIGAVIVRQMVSMKI